MNKTKKKAQDIRRFFARLRLSRGNRFLCGPWRRRVGRRSPPQDGSHAANHLGQAILLALGLRTGSRHIADVVLFMGRGESMGVNGEPEKSSWWFAK